MALSSSRINFGESSPQPQSRSPLPAGSSSPQQHPLQQSLRPAPAAIQPALEASRTDLTGLEEEVIKSKTDLQEMRNVVKRPEKDVKELNLQRDSGSTTQGLGRIPHEAGISKDKDLTDSEDPELKDSTDSKDLIVRDSTDSEDLADEDSKDPDSKGQDSEER